MLTFEPIQLNRRGEYLEYYRQCLEKASDYSFVNIWSWAENINMNGLGPMIWSGCVTATVRFTFTERR